MELPSRVYSCQNYQNPTEACRESLELAKQWCLCAMVVHSAWDTLRGENGARVLLLSNLCGPRNLGTRHNWTPYPKSGKQEPLTPPSPFRHLLASSALHTLTSSEGVTFLMRETENTLLQTGEYSETGHLQPKRLGRLKRGMECVSIAIKN